MRYLRGRMFDRDRSRLLKAINPLLCKWSRCYGENFVVNDNARCVRVPWTKRHIFILDRKRNLALKTILIWMWLRYCPSAEPFSMNAETEIGHYVPHDLERWKSKRYILGFGVADMWYWRGKRALKYMKRNGPRLFTAPSFVFAPPVRSKFSMNLQYATRQECDLHFRECTIPAVRRAISCKYYLLVWNNVGSVGTCMTFGMKAITTAVC